MDDNMTYIFQGSGFTDLTLYQYGKEKCTPLHSCGPATFNHYVLHYILEGKGTLTIGTDRHHQLKAGQAFLICPRCIVTYTADKMQPWTYVWIEFDGLKAPSFLSDAGLGLKSPIYTATSASGSLELQNLMTGMLSYYDNPLRLLGNMYWILDTLIRTSSSRKPPKAANLQEFYIHEAMMYIERHYNQDITVAQLADWCNLDRSYFGRIFKETVLVTPQEYIIRYRINMACEMLKNTDLPIGDVASHVGYENQLHFSRAFKNVMGMPPREWKKRQLLSHDNSSETPNR